MKTVLLTRPTQNGGASIARLEGLGYSALNCPVMKTTAAAFDHHITATNLIITSQNGVKHGLKHIKDLSKHVFAVGSKTEAAVKAAGFHKVTTGLGTAEDLYQSTLKYHRSLDASQQAKNSFCHLAGADIAFDITKELTAFGIKAETRTVYKAVVEDNLAEKLQDLIKNNEIDTVLFYSAQTATIFEQTVREIHMEEALKKIKAISLSKRIDQELQSVWAMKKIAQQPNEDSLFKALEW